MKSISSRYLFFVLIFAATKSSVFLGPILLSGLVSTENYGLFEYTLALGGILAILISAGGDASYSYFILKRSRLHLINIFYIHPLITSSVLLLAIVTYEFDLIGIKFLFSILIGYIISVQNFIATKLKTEEKSISATIITSGIYLILILSLCLIFLVPTSELTLFWYILSLYCALLIIFIIKKVRTLNLKRVSKIYPKFLNFGFPIVFSSVFVLVITTSGRVFVELFIDTYSVAIYSFYFRLASIVVLLYQTVSVYFYKQLYVLPHGKLDLYFGSFLLVILFTGGVSFFTVPLVGMDMLKLLSETFNQYQKLYFLFVFQMVFWVGIALNENVINRENLAKNISVLFFFLCLLFSLGLFAYAEWYHLSLEKFVLVHSTVMYSGSELQYLVLRRQKGISFPRTRIVTFACFMLLLFVFFVY